MEPGGIRLLEALAACAGETHPDGGCRICGAPRDDPDHFLRHPNILAVQERFDAHEALVEEAAAHGHIDLSLTFEVAMSLLARGRMVVSRLATELGMPNEVVMLAARALADRGLVDLEDGGDGPGSVALLLRPPAQPVPVRGDDPRILAAFTKVMPRPAGP